MQLYLAFKDSSHFEKQLLEASYSLAFWDFKLSQILAHDLKDLLKSYY